MEFDLAMKLSFLLTCLGGLLAATAVNWRQMWDRRTLKQIYQDVTVGTQHVSLYTKIVGPISFALIIAGIYLSLTWR